MTLHGRLERRLAAFQRHRGGAAVRLRLPRQHRHGRGAGAARRGRLLRRAQPRQHHRRLPALARRETFVYRHRDLEHLAWGAASAPAAARALIVTDGVFSMDGDVAPLDGLAELARRHGCRLMVDEAHATGALGPGGRGAVAAAGLAGEVDVIVGTLGKALGSYGAYVCCAPRSRELLVNTARPFIFSTALPPPAVAAAATPRCAALRGGPGRSSGCGGTRACSAAALAADGLEVGARRTQIVPSVVGEAADAIALCEAVLERGVFAQAIRPPTVPEGTSRLRLTVIATHRESELRRRLGRDRGGRGGAEAERVAPERPAPSNARRERRPLRHRDRHRGRQDGGRRGDRPHAARSGGRRVAVFKPAVSGLDDEPARSPTTSSCAAPPDRPRPTTRSRPTATARRSRPTWRRAGRRARSTRRGCSRRRGAPRTAPTCSSARGSAGCSSRSPRLPGPRPRPRPRPAGGDRRLARAGHDQPHPADGRGGAGGRARGGGRRAHAVAGRARRDRALEPRDDRAARVPRGSRCFPGLDLAEPDGLAGARDLGAEAANSGFGTAVFPPGRGLSSTADVRTTRQLDHRHLWHPFTQQRGWVAEEPLVIERGRGHRPDRRRGQPLHRRRLLAVVQRPRPPPPG